MTRPERDAHLVLLMAKLADLMAEQQVSQAELARRMDTHPAVVSKMLSLKVDPRASTLLAALKALHRHIDMAEDVAS